MTESLRTSAEHVTAFARPGRWTCIALSVCLFVVVLGGKLIVLDRYGSDIPNWDQWDAEGHAVFLPYLQDRLDWGHLFAPHNEHRVVPSRLLALALLIVNGQWDSRLECVVNALLHAALAAAIFAYGCRLLHRRWTACWFVGVAAFIAPPVAWQNVLGGFHSQQIFLLGFTVLAAALLFHSRTWRVGWWLGLFCAFAAIVSQGSGLFIALIVAALFVSRARYMSSLREHGATIAFCVLLFALGWWLRVTVSYHDTLKARSIADFAATIWHSLQWPVRSFPGFPLLAWAPWAWLAWQVIVQRRWNEPAPCVIVACGGWTLLNYVATGFARGANGVWPAPRYLDTVAFGIIVNVLALLLIFSRVSLRGWRKWSRAGVSAAASVLLLHGLWREVDGSVTHELPGVVSAMRAREASTRAYLLTGDRGRLENADIPYPNAGVLEDRLRHPEIRSLLPASIRPPLPLRGEADPAGSFTPKGIPAALVEKSLDPYQGSFSSDHEGNRGRWSGELWPASPDGFWEVKVAGTLDRPHVSLAIVAADDQLVQTLTTGSAELSAWAALTVRAPNKPARLVAHDEGGDDWIAFTAPTFVAPWSHRAAQFVRGGEPLLVAGSLAALMILAAQAARLRSTSMQADARPASTVLTVGTTLTIGCALATGSYLWLTNRNLPEAWIEFSASVTRDTTVQCFVSDGRRGFRGGDVGETVIRPGAIAQRGRARLPGGMIRRLRLDPAQADHPVEIAELRITDATGRVLREFPSDAVVPLRQIARLERLGTSALRIVPENGANDPGVELKLDTPLLAARTMGKLLRRLIVPVSLVLALGCLLTFAAWHRLRGRGQP